MKTKKWTATALSLLLFAVPASAGIVLPQKAIAVEDGIIALHAGVMPSPAAMSALPIGKLKYPTRYFVELINESPYPVWLDAAWAFPKAGDKKAPSVKPVRSGKLPPGGNYWFYADKLGVITGQSITAEITVWSDEKRTQLAGKQLAELRFSQPDVDVFFANFPSPYKGRPSDGAAAVISGWYDLPKPRTDVPGTAADTVLAADIQRLIWKTDSVERFTCPREIISAELLNVDDSKAMLGTDAATQENARHEQQQGRFSVERWHVHSCGEAITFEVLLSAAEQGGTDISVVSTANLAKQTATASTE